MGYSTGPRGSIDEAEKLYNEAVTDMQHGRKESARSNLQQAKQIFQQCLGTHAKAQQWLDKTNQLLSKI